MNTEIRGIVGRALMGLAKGGYPFFLDGTGTGQERSNRGRAAFPAPTRARHLRKRSALALPRLGAATLIRNF